MAEIQVLKQMLQKQSNATDTGAGKTVTPESRGVDVKTFKQMSLTIYKGKWGRIQAIEYTWITAHLPHFSVSTGRYLLY
jgi:hypothetical protein